MTDIRTIRTKEKIRNALIELMKEHSYDSVNVTDITDKAGINRVTFYTHYQEKDDALQDVIDQFISKALLKTSEVVNKDNLISTSLVNYATTGIVTLIDYFDSSSDLIVCLSKTKDPVIYSFFEKALYKRLEEVIKKSPVKGLAAKNKLALQFSFAGFHKVTLEWITTRYCPKEEFIKDIKEFIVAYITSDVFKKYE